MKHFKSYSEFKLQEKYEGVEVSTRRYERVHGKKPRGNGMWAFYLDPVGDEPIFTPSAMNYTDAVKWASLKARNMGKKVIYVGESVNEAYNGNMSDFKYDLEMAVEELGISGNAIKKVSKSGKGYEVRMSSYMSQRGTWEKIGELIGATLVDFKADKSINVGIYERETSITEGEALIFDIVEPEFNDLKNKISDLNKKTVDLKWRKALDQIQREVEKLEFFISKYDKQLGAIETNESLVNEGKHWHVLSGNAWYTGSDFSTNPADAMKYDDIMSATKVAKKVGGMVHVMTDEEMTKAIKKFGKKESVNEAKKPKSWDTTFAMNAIADYEAGKFDPDNDKSLADWEKEYNGGKKPNPGFETYDIIAYALTTGKKPDGTPIKESLNEREYSDEERKDMADKGLALPDGSFPIKDLEDLKNAIQAYGRSKDQSTTAKFIVKRAKALSAEDLIPDTEDFQKALKETITEGNAFLAARAKAIDEDAEEFEFNGKKYPVLNRPKKLNEELSDSDAYKIIDIGSKFSKEVGGHLLATQTFDTANDFVDYLLSEFIPKKDHPKFLKSVKSLM